MNRLIYLIVLTCLFSCGIFQQADAQGFASITSNGDLGTVKPSKTPRPGSFTILPDTSSSTWLRVISIKWSNGTQPSYIKTLSAPSVGDSFSQPMTYPFEIDISTPGRYSDVMQIEVECADGNLCIDKPRTTLEIVFRMEVECSPSDSSCHPKGPACSIDFNSQYYVYFPVPSFGSRVSEPLYSVTKTHYSGLKTYKLPIDVFWAIAGLADFFDPINDKACECANQCQLGKESKCLPEIMFNHSPGSAIHSTFTWENPSNTSLTVASKPNPFYEITFILPPRIKGSALVGGSYVEFWFENAAVAPMLNVKYIGPPGDYPSGSILFDGPMQCTGTTRDYAAILHPDQGVDIPLIHLYASDR